MPNTCSIQIIPVSTDPGHYPARQVQDRIRKAKLANAQLEAAQEALLQKLADMPLEFEMEIQLKLYAHLRNGTVMIDYSDIEDADCAKLVKLYIEDSWTTFAREWKRLSRECPRFSPLAG